MWPVLLSGALGVSNGHLQSLVMLAAPAALPPGLQRDSAAFIVQFALGVGYTLGSVVSVTLMAALQT